MSTDWPLRQHTAAAVVQLLVSLLYWSTTVAQCADSLHVLLRMSAERDFETALAPVISHHLLADDRASPTCMSLWRRSEVGAGITFCWCAPTTHRITLGQADSIVRLQVCRHMHQGMHAGGPARVCGSSYDHISPLWLGVVQELTQLQAHTLLRLPKQGTFRYFVARLW